MRIIAAIDILNGKCVRLTRGDYNTSKIYNDDPVEMAKFLEGKGIKFLHLVDLDGAREKRVVNHEIIARIAKKTSLRIDFGGGIRSSDDLEIAFSSGATQVTAGSIALKSPEIVIKWLEQYGNEKIILGADTIDRGIATDGWTNNSGEDIMEYLQGFVGHGFKYAICTDVAKDGMLEGPSTGLYLDILNSVKINLIASGGISTIDDLVNLKAIGCEGAIVGKAIYEGKILLEELKKLC